MTPAAPSIQSVLLERPAARPARPGSRWLRDRLARLVRDAEPIAAVAVAPTDRGRKSPSAAEVTPTSLAELLWQRTRRTDYVWVEEHQVVVLVPGRDCDGLLRRLDRDLPDGWRAARIG